MSRAATPLNPARTSGGMSFLDAPGAAQGHGHPTAQNGSFFAEHFQKVMHNNRLDELGEEFTMLLELVAKQVERMQILLEKTDNAIVYEDDYGAVSSNLVFCADQLSDMEDWIRTLHDDKQLRRHRRDTRRSPGGAPRQPGGGVRPRSRSLASPQHSHRGPASPGGISTSQPLPASTAGTPASAVISASAALATEANKTAPLEPFVAEDNNATADMEVLSLPKTVDDSVCKMLGEPLRGDFFGDQDCVETDPLVISHSHVPSEPAEDNQPAPRRFGFGFLYSTMSFDLEGAGGGERGGRTASFNRRAAARKKFREPVITRSVIHWLAIAALLWQVLSIGVVMLCSSLKVAHNRDEDGWLLFAMLLLIVFQIAHVIANITIMYKIGNQVAHLTISFELLWQSYLSLVLAMAGIYYLFTVVDFQAFEIPHDWLPTATDNGTVLEGVMGSHKKTQIPDLLVADPAYQARHFLHMLYFSCTVMTGCGFGDVTPRAWYAEVVVTLQQLLSVTFSTVICGLALQHFTTRMHLRKKALEERRLRAAELHETLSQHVSGVDVDWDGVDNAAGGGNNG
eukprot:TRINITY_DN27300_c0_g1_i1.p1 TRINITY_DN27300_c0_g1~~TRINITY_DN27300_c0_g1_i1.p1  ORF type:complete len:569 (+),score=133.73 TRINITY_DN27300_c0_g1_i1:57-1763(+)